MAKRGFVPRRYRLAPRHFEFKLIEKKLVETTTGLRLYHRANSKVFGRVRPNDDLSEHRLYFLRDGTPSDPLTEYLCRRDMTDFLSVWLCRLAPDVTREAKSKDDLDWWERELRRHGMPADLPALSGGGYSSDDTARLDDWLSGVRKRSLPPPKQSRPRRSFVEIAPAEWRRAVVRRLALIFSLPKRDPSIVRLAGYFAGSSSLIHRWPDDPDLQTLHTRYQTEERLRRLMGVLATFSVRRTRVAYGKEVRRKPLRLTCKNPCGRFVFCFPVRRRGTQVHDEQQRVRKLLWSFAPLTVRGPWFEKRWIAAAVYLGREFLEFPKSLAKKTLTQDVVSRHFGLTRRQLTHAIQRVQAPHFMDAFWDRQRQIRRLKL